MNTKEKTLLDEQRNIFSNQTFEILKLELGQDAAEKIISDIMNNLPYPKTNEKTRTRI